MTQFVIIRDMSAGNDTIGETWQETKIFSGDATLDAVMLWAMDSGGRFSRKHIQITQPANHKEVVI